MFGNDDQAEQLVYVNILRHCIGDPERCGRRSARCTRISCSPMCQATIPTLTAWQVVYPTEMVMHPSESIQQGLASGSMFVHRIYVRDPDAEQVWASQPIGGMRPPFTTPTNESWRLTMDALSEIQQAVLSEFDEQVEIDRRTIRVLSDGPDLPHGAGEVLLAVGTSVGAAAVYDMLKSAFYRTSGHEDLVEELTLDQARFVASHEMHRAFGRRHGTLPDLETGGADSEQQLSAYEWHLEVEHDGYLYEATVVNSLVARQCRVKRSRVP